MSEAEGPPPIESVSPGARPSAGDSAGHRSHGGADPEKGVLQMARSSSQTQEPSAYPGIVESTEEYKFVERLIPPAGIPEPPRHQSYPTPSGWQPPKDPPPKLPYFIRRSRMHNVPVYTELTHGNRQMTLIRKVEGNIWALQKDVEEFLSPLIGKTPVTQVNEVTGTLRIKGYFDQQLKAWLMEKGF